jgi:hypothetical protein
MVAQAVTAQKFGLKGGINIANMKFSASGINFSPTSLVGFQVGPVADFKLQNSLYFNTGLLYSLKGCKLEYQGESITDKFNYLEVPLNATYKFPLAEKSNFFIEAGPYLAYALSAKEKVNGETEDINFKDDGVKRFDYGIGFGAGVEYSSLVARLNYQLELANINDDSDTTVKNKVLQISIAYMFGK